MEMPRAIARRMQRRRARPQRRVLTRMALFDVDIISRSQAWMQLVMQSKLPQQACSTLCEPPLHMHGAGVPDVDRLTANKTSAWLK